MKINIIERETLKRFPINLLKNYAKKGKFYKRSSSENVIRYYFLDPELLGIIEIYMINGVGGLQYRTFDWFEGFDITVDEVDAEIEITIKEL